MKRNAIIWGAAIILVCIAAYTMFAYNSTPPSQPPVADNNVQKNAPSESPDAVNEGKEQKPEQETQPKAAVSNPAKDFTLTDLNGNTVQLSALKGKKVFLNFWATWCPPCRAEMPDIEKLFKEGIDDLVIIAVNIGEDKETVENFTKKSGYTFKILLDPDAKAANLYNIRAIPASYFINTDGSISNQHVGAMNYEQMKEYIKALK